jgi:hypothetical protein
MLSVVAPRLRGWYHGLIGTRSRQARGPRTVVSGGVLAPPSCPLFHPEGFADVSVLQPGLDFYLGLIARGDGFAFVKRTHGFWDGLVYLCESAPAIESRVVAGERVTAAIVRETLASAVVVETAERLSGYVNHYRDQFYTELVEDLQSPLVTPFYMDATSFRGYPNSDERPALHAVQWLRRVHQSFHTSGRAAHDALVWKHAIFDGTFHRVVEAVHEMPVVLIGPDHLATLGQHLGLAEFHHVVIPLAGAPAERGSLLRRCCDALRRASASARPPVVLYQCGALAFWLIYRLFPLVPRSIHLDVGRCLDVWYPEVVERQPWFVQNRDQIITNMRLEHFHR